MCADQADSFSTEHVRRVACWVGAVGVGGIWHRQRTHTVSERKSGSERARRGGEGGAHRDRQTHRQTKRDRERQRETERQRDSAAPAIGCTVHVPHAESVLRLIFDLK